MCRAWASAHPYVDVRVSQEGSRVGEDAGNVTVEVVPRSATRARVDPSMIEVRGQKCGESSVQAIGFMAEKWGYTVHSRVCFTSAQYHRYIALQSDHRYSQGALRAREPS